MKRLLKKQVVRIMSCSPDAQCSRDHSAEEPGKSGGTKAKSETGSASPEETPDGSASPGEMQDEGPEEALEAGEPLPPFLLREGGDDRLHSAEQDADDEAADDTDDTSSVTSSASSTTSSQSGSGTNRKKSIPLSIKNLKRKHKRKKNKITRDFKPGDRYIQRAGPPPSWLSVQPGTIPLTPHVHTRAHTQDLQPYKAGVRTVFPAKGNLDT